ncbi:Chitin deacetylase [Psilocybe cubensis]|uniref:Chitin deacetylase n=2 Tax=Psilocybe cubensis TaxID=181762 RepID=A0ACB8HHC1_PSICU|nr:Chitin deacetylase [Psilocybe cubensis]KAH9487077.1 Chitin deacetylase [Psilocybe cubensis]
MRFSQSTVFAILPALVVARNQGQQFARQHDLNARQNPATGSTTTASVPVGTSASSVSGTAAATPTLATTFTFKLDATNPTAVPLSVINAAQPSSVTKPLDSTAVPGTIPTFIPNAPPLPNAALLNPANYPVLDKVPPVDSPEVKGWIDEVTATGIVIPSFDPTQPGGCPNNTAAVADTSRCWWTCGGCTRSTDVTQCPAPLNWGLTYDDGPAPYTSNLLSYLDQTNLKSTFFVVGSRVISFPATLQTQFLGQHHIAVHTWSHPSLTTLTNEQIIAELGWSKKVIKDVLGITPNLMRPPFGDIDDRVRAISMAMGLTPVMWTRISPLATFDTDDFNIHGGITSVQQVLQNWENILGNATTMSNGFIVLEHDLFEQSVEVATGYILPDALAHNPPFTIKPVIECLNKNMADAYIETNDNSTNPPALSAAVSAGVVTVTSAPASASNTSKSSAVSGQFNGAGLAYMATVIAGLAVGALLSLPF